MCGRYVTPDIAEAERNLLVHLVNWQFARSYNVAPTQMVPVVRLTEGRNEGLLMRFGLVPFFARGVAPKYSTINATMEKLKERSRVAWSVEARAALPDTGHRFL